MKVLFFKGDTHCTYFFSFTYHMVCFVCFFKDSFIDCAFQKCQVNIHVLSLALQTLVLSTLTNLKGWTSNYRFLQLAWLNLSLESM